MLIGVGIEAESRLCPQHSTAFGIDFCDLFWGTLFLHKY